MRSETSMIYIRSAIYVCATLLLYFVIQADASLAASRFFENSLTESLQELIFLALVVAYGIHARLVQQADVLALMFAGFFLMAFIRELDDILEDNIATGVWQALVFAVLVAMALKARAQWERLKQQVSEYAGSYAFGLFIAGFLVTFAFSRVAGNEEIWMSLMGETEYQRNVKNAVEEILELLGDTIMGFSCVEFICRYRNRDSGFRSPANTVY